MKKILIILVSLVVLLYAAVGCSPQAPEPAPAPAPAETPDDGNPKEVEEFEALKEYGQITIATGVTTGSWYPIGAAMSQIYGEYGIKANAEPGGGVSNVVLVSNGEAEIGMTTANVPSVGIAGELPFTEKYENFSAMAFLFNNYLHVIVSEDSGVNSIPDLAGKSFSNQAVGTATQMTFIDLLKAYDMDESDMSIQVGGQAEGADQIKDNIVVGLTATTPAPSGSLTELMISKPCKILPFDSGVLSKMQEINPGYMKFILPAGTYEGQNEDIEGIGSPLVLLVNNDLSDEVVYDMVKALVENIEVLRQSHNTMANLTVEMMADVGGLDMHPGAKKFFDEYLGK